MLAADLTMAPLVWPGNTTPVAVDGSGTTARTLTGWSLQNAAASVRYVRLFDTNVAPTMGATAPKLVIPLALTSVSVFFLPRGLNFNNGLWVSVTTGEPVLDNTAPTASDLMIGGLFYRGD